jgi:hypothetical protein
VANPSASEADACSSGQLGRLHLLPLRPLRLPQPSTNEPRVDRQAHGITCPRFTPAAGCRWTRSPPPAPPPAVPWPLGSPPAARHTPPTTSTVVSPRPRATLRRRCTMRVHRRTEWNGHARSGAVSDTSHPLSTRTLKGTARRSLIHGHPLHGLTCDGHWLWCRRSDVRACATRSKEAVARAATPLGRQTASVRGSTGCGGWKAHLLAVLRLELQARGLAPKHRECRSRETSTRPQVG